MAIRQPAIHRHGRWTRLGAFFLLAGSLIFLVHTPEAHGQAAGTPDVPAPEECTVAPRSLPLPNGTATAIAPAESPTPFVPPTGDPADETTRAAVTATIRQSIACANARDILRGLALYTDRFLANQLVGPNGITQENMALLAETPPAAVPAAERLSLVAVRDAVVLPDGRVGATVITRNADGTFEDYVIFAKVGNDWLIDKAVRLQSPYGTPTP